MTWVNSLSDGQFLTLVLWGYIVVVVLAGWLHGDKRWPL